MHAKIKVQKAYRHHHHGIHIARFTPWFLGDCRYDSHKINSCDTPFAKANTSCKPTDAHELTLTSIVIQVFVLIFVPWYFGSAYGFVFSAQWHTDLFLIGTLAVAAYAAQYFVIWYLNYYVVTSERLLHIHHIDAFRRVVTETSLDRILNVSYRTTGFFSTLFHYGDVSVQAVGMEEPFVLKDVPDPEKVKDYIWGEHLKHGGGTHITYTKPAVGISDHSENPNNAEAAFGNSESNSDPES